MFTTTLMSVAALCLAAPQAGEVPKLETAKAQLEHAKKAKTASHGLKGAERVTALDKAVAAYAAVGQHWPSAGAVTSEAAFRRGELQRTLGRPGLARGAFEEAYDAGQGTAFAPRAVLEIGHIHRRAREFDKALAQYQRALKVEGIQLRYQNDAREWIGKVHLTLKQWDKAAAAFALWAKEAEGPIERVRAIDQESRAWVGSGDLVTAEARITRLMLDVESLAGAPSKEGEALRKAIERMKGPDLIAEARRKAEKASSVAAQLRPAA